MKRLKEACTGAAVPRGIESDNHCCEIKKNHQNYDVTECQERSDGRDLCLWNGPDPDRSSNYGFAAFREQAPA